MSVTGEAAARGHDDNWDRNHNQWVCVCLRIRVCVCGVVGVRFGGPSCHMGFDWWMADAWWWMHTHIKPIDGRTQVRRGFGSLRQCYSFIKAESHCGHRSWRWQANIMSGWVDNDAMKVRVTGWRGINICKAPAGWCEIAVMAGFLHCFECVFFVFWSPTNTFLAHFSFVKFFSSIFVPLAGGKIISKCLIFQHRLAFFFFYLQFSHFPSFFFFSSARLSLSANLLTFTLIITQYW